MGINDMAGRVPSPFIQIAFNTKFYSSSVKNAKYDFDQIKQVR